MRRLLLFSLGLFLVTNLNAQFATYDFDDSTTDAVLSYSASCNDNAADYFGSVCLNGGTCGSAVGGGVVLTGGDGGTFFGAHDIDADPGCPGSPAIASLSGFDITGQTDIVLCFEVAEDDDGSNQDWDGGDDVLISASIDGGTSLNLIGFSSSTTGTNTEPGIDSDCDGLSNGTALTSTFTTYCVSIPATGSSLDLNITVTGLTAGDEDIAIDNIRLFSGDLATVGTTAGAAATFTSCDAPATCEFTTGSVAITEIHYNPCTGQGTDGNCEYVEIFNAYANAIDISGWEIDGFGFTFPAATTIASGAYLVVGIGPNNCVDYDLSAGGVLTPATGSLTNSGETLSVLDACGNVVSSITYTNSNGNGDCNAVNVAPDGTLSSEAPSPGTGICTPSTDNYTLACGISALGAATQDCLNYTGGADPVRVSIPYTGIDICAVITNNGSGTIGGDDLTTVTDGTIEITLNEGETWDIEITGSGCSGLTSTGTVSAMECTATCGVNASASSATVNISSTTSAATVNTLDDTYVNALEAANCGADELDMVYGAMTWDNAADQGNIDGLVITDGTNLGTPYSGVATYDLREVVQGCNGTGNNGIVIDANSSNNIISTNENSMQGGSPKPSFIGGHFTENDGTRTGVNMICMNFSVPVEEVTFWLGDAETSDVNPAYVHVFDAAGDVMISEPVTTVTPSGSQATDCTGSTGGTGFTGCGNNETAFVEVDAGAALIAQICVEVGDFADDNTDPGGSEHLSIGGISLGGVCIDRDPEPSCTDLLDYQEFDGSVNSWSYAAFPAAYSEDTDSDIWQPRTLATGGTGSIASQGTGNNFYWGIRDIDNSGSGGNFEHTLTFTYDVSCYENVSVNFDYTASLFDSGDYLAYEIQDENGASIVAKTDLVNASSAPWTTSTNAIPNTANAITLILYADQNGTADSGGFDKVYICGTPIAAAPLTATLDGSCGNNTGTVTLDLSGGTAPYEISGDFSRILPASGNGLVIASGLTADTYSVIVTDNCGNMSAQTVVVDVACALPVELTYFYAEKEGNDVLLSWETASEENNDFFVVEYSGNGIDFREIGIVNGAGTTLELTQYQFLHVEPSTENYYRLKQVDFDGTFAYSKIEVVVFETVLDANAISVRPTISKHSVTLVSQSELDSNTRILIYDATGILVRQMQLTESKYMTTIDVRNLSAGHYFIQVQGESGSHTTRFIKQ